MTGDTLRRHAARALRADLTHAPWWAGPRLVLVFSPLFGLAAGSYSANEPARAFFMLFSAVKIPLLLLSTASLCLPPFFVAHAALGRRDDFPVSLRAVLTAQATAALILAALAPLVPVFYSASGRHNDAILCCGACFTAAAAGSLLLPARAYRAAGLTLPVHKALLALWFTLYAFVGIQMGWMGRPFIGTPGSPVAFLRDDPFTNGYVVIFRILTGS